VPSIPQKPQIEENSNESNYSEDSYVSGAASDAEDVSEERPKMKLLSFAGIWLLFGFGKVSYSNDHFCCRFG
jgi:hypothetical protein